MLSHEEMIGLQAEKHDLIQEKKFRSKEEYVLHLIHTIAYIKASEICKNLCALDIGCNTGYGSHILSKSAKKIVGVDVSQKAIEFANNRYAQSGIQFKVIDGKRLPFKDQEFDVIVCCQVIEHIVDYKMFMEELKRVLSPEGIVFFTTPNALLRLDPGMKPWNQFHVREFAPNEIKATLGSFFKCVKEFGLFANEPLYSVEKNRLEDARKNARKVCDSSPSKNDGDLLFSVIKSIVSEQTYTNLKKIYHSLRKKKIDEGYDQNAFKEFDIHDLFYRDFDLENALDLLAICSDNVISIRNIC